MVQRAETPASLREADETGWLEAAAELIRAGRLAELELDTLAGYLEDMARRDRREVFSRLVVLLCHLLKWEHQPGRRSGSWLGTVLEQQRELRQLLESGTLRRHAEAVFADAYAEARKQAAAETGLARADFPEAPVVGPRRRPRRSRRMTDPFPRAWRPSCVHGPCRRWCWRSWWAVSRTRASRRATAARRRRPTGPP